MKIFLCVGYFFAPTVYKTDTDQFRTKIVIDELFQQEIRSYLKGGDLKVDFQSLSTVCRGIVNACEELFNLQLVSIA